MSAWQHVPGLVVPCSVVFARCGPASASPAQGGPVSLPRPIDADVTTGYVDTLVRHCSHSFHYGIASHLVLLGDMDWFHGVLPNTIVTLLTKFILQAREAGPALTVFGGPGPVGNIPDGGVSIAAGSFDVTGGGSGKPAFDSNVLRFDVRSSDPVEMCHRACGALQAAAAQSGKRVAWIRASVPDYMGCDISSTFFIPPPLEKMSWEVHHYLRQIDDDLLLSRNALTMFVWHTSTPVVSMAQLPMSGETFVTMSKQKERLCAAIPNTPAAKYLLESLDGRHNGSGGRDASSQSPQRSGPVSADILAMEIELASLRAACLQLSQRNQQLEQDMTQLKAVATQQQQMHQALLAGAATIAQATPHGLGGGAGSRGGLLLPPVARDGGKGSGQLVVGRSAVSPGQHATHHHDHSGWGEALQYLGELEEVLQAIQSSVLSVQPHDVLKGCLVWRQKEASALHACLNSIIAEVGRDLPPSLSAATTLGHLTVGASTGTDPLTELYRHRLQDTERELVRLAEFDVDGLTSQFYTDELRRMEHEATAWMTKYHALALSQRGGEGPHRSGK